MLGYDVQDGFALITLNRPEVLNAFDDDLGGAALDAVQRAAGDDGVRCIVITGAGRAFCAGEDLGALADDYKRGEAAPLGDILVRRYNPLVRALLAAPKPVVAAVNGIAAGAGVSLAMACDFRIASEHARFAVAFVNVGLVPDSGLLWFLTRAVGYSKAFELAATGATIGAQDALSMGLVNRVETAENFETAWRRWAGDLARGPTRALALTKALAAGATTQSLDDQLEDEVAAQTVAGDTADHLEGVTAFFDKRFPDFRGR